MHPHISADWFGLLSMSPELEDGYEKNKIECQQSIDFEKIFTGVCGVRQPAANPSNFLVCFLAPALCPNTYESELSHNLCNDFYVNAFENEFVADNYYNCTGVVDVRTLPYRFKMGYMELRKQ